MAGAEPPPGGKILKSFAALPHSDEAAAEWADSQIAENGRAATADTIAQWLVDDPALLEQAFLIRQIGSRVEPEFSESVLSRIEAADSSLTRGGLLQLLRNTAPENAPRIGRFLTDERPGEDFRERLPNAPKLSEAIGDGTEPFRVCDLAFNVISEITAPADGQAERMTRSEEMIQRDAQIRELETTLVPGRAGMSKRRDRDGYCKSGELMAQAEAKKRQMKQWALGGWAATLLAVGTIVTMRWKKRRLRRRYWLDRTIELP